MDITPNAAIGLDEIGDKAYSGTVFRRISQRKAMKSS